VVRFVMVTHHRRDRTRNRIARMIDRAAPAINRIARERLHE
jgi:hypothetical protein